MSLSPPAAHATPIPLAAFTVLRAAIEALAGRRPLHAVRRIFAPLAFQSFTTYVDNIRLRGVELRSVSAQMPSERAVEATVTLTHRGRQLACVVRLDHRNRWVCSHLTVIGLPQATDLAPPHYFGEPEQTRPVA